MSFPFKCVGRRGGGVVGRNILRHSTQRPYTFNEIPLRWLHILHTQILSHLWKDIPYPINTTVIHFPMERRERRCTMFWGYRQYILWSVYPGIFTCQRSGKKWKTKIKSQIFFLVTDIWNISWLKYNQLNTGQKSFLVFSCRRKKRKKKKQRKKRKIAVVRWGPYLQNCQWGFNMGKLKLSQISYPVVHYENKSLHTLYYISSIFLKFKLQTYPE